jgi:hypothetical protein
MCRNQFALALKLNQQKEFAWLIVNNGLAGRYDYIEGEMNLADGWNFPFAIGEIIIWKREPQLAILLLCLRLLIFIGKGILKLWVIQILKVKRQLVIRSG